MGPPDSLKKAKKHFIPLESNPSVFTGLAHSLGLPPSLEFQDVFGLDEAAVACLPRPVHALVLVFPAEGDGAATSRGLLSNERPVTTGSGEDVVWFRQVVGNACGLYGMLHAMCNGRTRQQIVPDSILSRILSAYSSVEPSERPKILEDSDELEAAYTKVARDGDSQAPANPEDDVDFHYTSFVKSATGGRLYELDGVLSGPMEVGTLGADEDVVSEKALQVIKEFIKIHGGEKIGFGMLALVEG